MKMEFNEKSNLMKKVASNKMRKNLRSKNKLISERFPTLQGMRNLYVK